jgi:hypothetical protein
MTSLEIKTYNSIQSLDGETAKKPAFYSRVDVEKLFRKEVVDKQLVNEIKLAIISSFVNRCNAEYFCTTIFSTEASGNAYIAGGFPSWMYYQTWDRVNETEKLVADVNIFVSTNFYKKYLENLMEICKGNKEEKIGFRKYGDNHELLVDIMRFKSKVQIIVCTDPLLKIANFDIDCCKVFFDPSQTIYDDNDEQKEFYLGVFHKLSRDKMDIEYRKSVPLYTYNVNDPIGKDSNWNKYRIKKYTERGFNLTKVDDTPVFINNFPPVNNSNLELTFNGISFHVGIHYMAMHFNYIAMLAKHIPLSKNLVVSLDEVPYATIEFIHQFLDNLYNDKKYVYTRENVMFIVAICDFLQFKEPIENILQKICEEKVENNLNKWYLESEDIAYLCHIGVKLNKTIFDKFIGMYNMLPIKEKMNSLKRLPKKMQDLIIEYCIRETNLSNFSTLICRFYEEKEEKDGDKSD